MTKRRSKYIDLFDYFDKSLIVLSVFTCIFNFYRNCEKTVINNKKQKEKA